MQTTNRLTLIGHVAALKAFAKVTKVTVVTTRTWVADGERKNAASHVPVSVLARPLPDATPGEGRRRPRDRARRIAGGLREVRVR